MSSFSLWEKQQHPTWNGNVEKKVPLFEKFPRNFNENSSQLPYHISFGAKNKIKI